jgi:hypothetical protein
MFRSIQRTNRGTLVQQIIQVNPNDSEQVDSMISYIRDSMSQGRQNYCNELSAALRTKNYAIAMYLASSRGNKCTLSDFFSKFIVTDEYISGRGFALANQLFKNETTFEIYDPEEVDQFLVPYDDAIIFVYNGNVDRRNMLLVAFINTVINWDIDDYYDDGEDDDREQIKHVSTKNICKWFLTKLIDFGPDALNPSRPNVTADRLFSILIKPIEQIYTKHLYQELVPLLCEAVRTNRHFRLRVAVGLRANNYMVDPITICYPVAAATMVQPTPSGYGEHAVPGASNLFSQYSMNPVTAADNTPPEQPILPLHEQNAAAAIPNAYVIPNIPVAQRMQLDPGFHASNPNERGVRLTKRMGGTNTKDAFKKRGRKTQTKPKIQICNRKSHTRKNRV